jgi:hypothetical protein
MAESLRTDEMRSGKMSVSPRGEDGMVEAVSSGPAICDSPTPCDTIARTCQQQPGCGAGNARRLMMLVRTS